MGYLSTDGHYGLPLDAEHQQSPVSCPSGYLCCDDSFGHFRVVTQHSATSIPPPSSSSELGNALVEIHSLEPQQMGRASIALPSLPLPPQTTPKHDSSEGAVGLNSIKSEYGATASGQPFSPMTSLDSPSLTGDHTTYIKKEEDQEQLNVGNSLMPRRSSPLHGHGPHPHRLHALDSFRLVQDPAAYRGFAPSTKVRSCLTIAYSYSSKYRGSPRHRPYPFLVRSRIPLVPVSLRRSRLRSRPPIRGHLRRA